VAASEADVMPVPAGQGDARKRLVLTLSRVWAWVFLVGLILFFWISVAITSGGDVNFLTIRNGENILMAITPVLLMGIGETFVIISGGIDLSVGWVMGLASVVSALATVQLMDAGADQVVAISIGFALGVLAAMLCGLINGVIIAKLKITSFIVTLGMSFIARGVAFVMSGGNVVGGQPPGMRNFGNEALIYIMPNGKDSFFGLYFFQKPEVTGTALQSLDRVLQWPVVVTAIVTVIAAFVLARMQFGRHTYAVGGNKEASLRAGVPVDRLTIAIFVLSGFMAGLAGVLHTARFTGGSSIAGESLLLSAIAAVIIGGVSMFGGRGNITGTVIGALIIALLTTGLVMLDVEPFYQFIVIGVVVILAVAIDQARDLIIGRAEAQY
jgi:ribose/xylose/arabinose/galactoside ABC-type transport system permease subunit